MVELHVNLREIAVFLAIMLRLSVVLFMMPVFTSIHYPNAAKIYTILALACLVYLLPHGMINPIPFEPAPLVKVVLWEVVFGLVMALAFPMIFGAFEFAGEMITFQMGFGFAQVADPQGGAQIMFLSGWFKLVSTLIFFSLNGHHVVLRAIMDSFHKIPIGGFVLDADIFGSIIGLSGQLFVIGIKIAAPIMVALLLTHVGMGILSKFAPQVNILTASFPLTIMLGFIFMGISVPIWAAAVATYLGMMMKVLLRLGQ